MTTGRFAVISDLHLGSAFCRHQLFYRFLKSLAEDVTLILAGDTIDSPGVELSRSEYQVLDLLACRSRKSPIIWIEGNHDAGYRPGEFENAAFGKDFVIQQQFYTTHGDRFDHLLPRNRWFLILFNLMHSVRIYLGAQPVHVACFAKRFRFLYGFLCRHVRENAVEHAREIGVPNVVCGHVHLAEDTVIRGIRYTNLGSWTEEGTHCFLIADNKGDFRPVEEALNDDFWFSEFSPSHFSGKIAV